MAASSAARWTSPIAIAAGVLWAMQGLIWAMAPKVQAETTPYAIINRPLFAIVWLSIIGATLFSGLAILGLHGQQTRHGRTTRAARIAARATVALAGVAGLSVALATVGLAESFFIGVLSLALLLVGLALLVGLSLIGVAILTTAAQPSWHDYLPATLAALTLLTLVAIVGNGARAEAALIAAVSVVSVLGATWVLLGYALLPRQATSRPITLDATEY